MNTATDQIVLQGTLVAPHAVEWLGQAGRLRVHSLYRQSLNLIDRRGELFSLVLPAVGPGPFALVVQPTRRSPWPAGGFAGLLEVDSRVDLKAEVIEVGPLEVRLSDLELWQPCPDWDRLRAGLTPVQLQRLAELLQHHAPAGSLAPLADSLALREADAGLAPQQLELAMPRALAGPARRLLIELVLGNPDRVRGAAANLSGLGGGVTPAGDDFLLGAVHALWITCPRDRVRELATGVVAAAGPRTNAVSLAWLRAAARGEAANEWHALFEAVLAGRPIDQVARVLIRHGHTSGADALAGFVATRRALTAHAQASQPLPLPN